MHPHLSLPLQRTPPFMQLERRRRPCAYAAQCARGAAEWIGERRTLLRLPAAAGSDLNINAAGCARAKPRCIHAALFLAACIIKGRWWLQWVVLGPHALAEKKGLKILARTLRAQLIASARIVSFMTSARAAVAARGLQLCGEYCKRRRLTHTLQRDVRVF